MEVMQTPTAENSLDQNVAIKQGSAVAALPLEHEVRLMLMQFILLIELLLYLSECLCKRQRLGSTTG